MIKRYKDVNGDTKTPADFGATYLSDEMAAMLGLTEVGEDYEKPQTTEEIKQQKYSAINADYSQKIAAVCTSGIPAAKQDALIADLRTKWKAAIIAVSES